MRRLRDVSIKYKLVGIIMLTSVLALLMTGLAFVGYEQITFRGRMTRDFSILAAVIGENVSPGLAFNDATAMEKTLQSLAAQQRVLAAAVFDKAGQRVATFERSKRPGGFNWPEKQPPGSYFEADRLGTFQAIVLVGETIGTLYIASDLTELAERRTSYALIFAQVLLASSLVAYLVASRLQRVISDPILSLAATATRVAVEKDYTLRAPKRGTDELGSLVDRFNDMLNEIQRQAQSLRDASEELEVRVQKRTRQLQEEVAEHQRAREELTQAQRQLVDSSRQAGMAEVATSVLHNVGNVLNSVNVSITILRQNTISSNLGSLVKLGGLMKQREADLIAFLTTDPKGKRVPDFIILLADQLVAENKAVQAEQDQLARNIEHIKEIVAMQQNYAQISGILEHVSVAELLDHALQMNIASLSVHAVNVVRHFTDVPPATVDKHKVLQILVNLVQNAIHALGESGRLDKELAVGLGMNGADRVQITVTDNGIGVPPENLTRIFSHGFSTRKDGHGFGLHSGANAAKEMGGRLIAYSEGTGKGATFTLELPLFPSREPEVLRKGNEQD